MCNGCMGIQPIWWHSWVTWVTVEWLWLTLPLSSTVAGGVGLNFFVRLVSTSAMPSTVPTVRRRPCLSCSSFSGTDCEVPKLDPIWNRLPVAWVLGLPGSPKGPGGPAAPTAVEGLTLPSSYSPVAKQGWDWSLAAAELGRTFRLEGLGSIPGGMALCACTTSSWSSRRLSSEVTVLRGTCGCQGLAVRPNSCSASCS